MESVMAQQRDEEHPGVADKPTRDIYSRKKAERVPFVDEGKFSTSGKADR